MSVQQGPTLRQHAEYAPLVARAGAMVDSVIDPVSAAGTWDLESGEGGRPRLILRLRDDAEGQASAAFDPSELTTPAHFNRRVMALRDAFLRLKRWRAEVRRLFATISEWSEALPGGASLREEPITIHEKRSGPYEMSRLVIMSGGASMSVEPVAAWVVGADGRVDLKGNGGPFTLVYSRAEGWRCVLDTFPVVKTPDLTKELFLELAHACLHE